MSDFSKKDVKKGKERKPFFTEKTVQSFTEKEASPKGEELSPEDEPTFAYDNVDYMMPFPEDHDVSTGCFPVGGITLAEQELQRFLYMDVGRWGGSGGKNSTEEHWRGDRYFGLTCGEVAVLCRYAPPLTRKPMAGEWRPGKLFNESIKSHNDFCRMVPLLNHLSSDPRLGQVEVLKALACTCPKLKAPSSDTIYVYLGDLHAPIITQAARTNAPEIAPYLEVQRQLSWIDWLKASSPSILWPLLVKDMNNANARV
jgi:hypothetical protein